MKFKKLISVFLCLLIIVCMFTACDNNGDKIIYVNIFDKPTTLDPQLAETDEELMICRNIYEGLLRKNDKGDIVAGACKLCEKSGLIYTFDLRENLQWSNGTNITANDFVFAFRRAVDPSVKAPFARRLKNIKNALDIIEGRAPTQSLGVKATGDYSLRIELIKEDPMFESILTTSVCMPCNEDFLNQSAGKYGRSAECIISNGSYYLKKWNQEDFGIRLIKNEGYSGDFEAKNGGIFISANKEQKISELFEKESVDCAIVKSQDYDSVIKTGVNHKSFQNICWFITIGKTYNDTIRSAFLKTVNSNVYKNKLKSGLSVADSIYPNTLKTGENTDRIGFVDYDIEGAKSTFSSIVKNMEDRHFPKTVLYYYDNTVTIDVLKAVLGHWQQNLSAYINITPAKHPEELSNELKVSSLEFSWFPIKIKSSSIEEYLENFDVDSSLDAVSAQKQILESHTVLPVCFENTNICYNKSINNIFCESENGYIDFSFAVKK